MHIVFVLLFFLLVFGFSSWMAMRADQAAELAEDESQEGLQGPAWLVSSWQDDTASVSARSSG